MRGLPGLHRRLQRRVVRSGRVGADARPDDASRRDLPEPLFQPARGPVQPVRSPSLRRAVPLGRDVSGRGRHRPRGRGRLHRCGFCIEACPYEARFINSRTKKVDKCDFCRPRIERGEEPACVATCTAHAKYFGDLEDRNSEVSRFVFRDGARRMETRAVAVGPNVFYLGRPEHLDLVLSSYPPRPPRLLTAGEAWTRLLKPLVLVMVGATFAGQAVAFFTQLRNGEGDFEE